VYWITRALISRFAIDYNKSSIRGSLGKGTEEMFAVLSISFWLDFFFGAVVEIQADGLYKMSVRATYWRGSKALWSIKDRFTQ